ncbi:MAG: sulfurtransferase TusA family protein [Kofleriaceae bacterium]|jgi:tRNA 2-thiouridine synthesizing protein A|nr:sulfurtransferase TusA family protein [Kofleriaceae bacterium]MBP9169000.1 sulfurtransferase TusA family protein [Kofleriaceae bacterium]MBP9858853.1 sulfurtransferase TusA family protein [Kofleriaceae bacterium]
MSTTTPSSTPSPPPRSGSGDDLDLRGEVCPYTFVAARLALEELPLGAALTLRFDHPPAAVNLPRSLTAWGQEVGAVEVDGDGWRLTVVKRTA